MVLGPRLGLPGAMDYRVTHIVDRMREGLHGELPLEDLAAEVGLSASRLAFLFRHETGRSPGAYLHTLRMERARVLVESTDLPVREVMRQVGLSDPSHFSRDFRNAHGFSPRAYRLQLRMAGPPIRYIRGRQEVAHADDLRTDRPTGPRAAVSPAVNNSSNNKENRNNEHHETTGGRDDGSGHDGDGGRAVRKRSDGPAARKQR